MMVVWKVTLAIVGLCFCYVYAGKQCMCVDYNTCTARNGTVSKTTSGFFESTKQCQTEEVMCCSSISDDSLTVSDNLNPHIQEPKVAPGGGCGRRRFTSDYSNTNKGEKPAHQRAFYGEFPWMVAIIQKKNLTLRCGGTLITPKVVLTAADCFLNNELPTNLLVQAGEYDTRIKNKPIPSQWRSVYKMVPHPDYQSNNIKNDIALLILEQPMQLNPTVDVICTPEEGREVITSECIMTGFGYNTSGSYQAILKKTNFTPRSREYCLEKMKTEGALPHFHKSSICADGNEEKGVCLGDGGGPLFCPLQADPNKMVQIGIVSWSKGCGEKFPLVFTSVEHYLPWLQEELS